MSVSFAHLWTHSALMPDSDSLYHRLFSIPGMVEMLVREFMPRKLPTREETDVCLYLLFEFQSRIDWWMAVRAQIYTGLLWQQVIDERKLETGARLPPLLMLVIYNGTRRWKAPTQIRKLIASSQVLRCRQPNLRYLLLDIGAFSADELARRRSLAALLFRLERPLAPRELERLRGEVSSWFRQHPDQERLRGLFAELVRQAFEAQGLAEGLAEGKTRGIAEGLAEGKARGVAEGLAEGRARGIAEGKARGIAEGKAEALVCLLVERFGALAPSLQTRIRKARLATLDQWFKRAITARNLRSVFNSPR